MDLVRIDKQLIHAPLTPRYDLTIGEASAISRVSRFPDIASRGTFPVRVAKACGK